AEVIHSPFSGIHASGHASQEELKFLLNLVRPKFFVPIHGEYRMLVTHKRLAMAVGIPEENIQLAENGDRLELTPDSLRVAERVPSGQVLVDGLGVGDVGQVVLRDRRGLSQDGMMLVVVTVARRTRPPVAGPEGVSRGIGRVPGWGELQEGGRLSV